MCWWVFALFGSWKNYRFKGSLGQKMGRRWWFMKQTIVQWLDEERQELRQP